MKRLILIITLIISSASLSAQSQEEQLRKRDSVLNSVVVEKLVQPDVKRVMDPQNEKHLTQETAKVIKDDRFKRFTVLVGWYKQTKTYYYYQIGWIINNKPTLQYMKYSWLDQSVTPATRAQIDADNDF